MVHNNPEKADCIRLSFIDTIIMPETLTANPYENESRPERLRLNVIDFERLFHRCIDICPEGAVKKNCFSCWVLNLTIILIITACSPQATSTSLSNGNGLPGPDTQEAQTAAASLPTDIALPPTPTRTPTPSPTITPTSTITPTPSEPPPMISVTANTNCRAGPGTSFPHQGVLLVGESAEVIAKSSIEGFWYILLPADPTEPCWMSGVYATVEGDTSVLPTYTPMPTPAPPVGFDLYLQGFEACGSTTYVVFSVKNAGVEVLKSANVEVVEFETGRSLYGPTFQRFPFAQVVRPVCPPDHGNILNPGVIAFIHVPISPVPHGKTARGSIMLCTADWLGGDCVTKEIYFHVE